MKRWRMKPPNHLIAAVICFLIALLCFVGVIYRDDLVGRVVVGAIWTVAGIGWTSRYYYVRLQAREREVRDLRENLLAQTRDTAIQQERNRLARELHDSIKQQIFSINISAAAAQARWENDPQAARAAIDDVRTSAQETMVEMNALLQQLSPVPLEKVGLRQALHDQCQALGYRTGAEVVAEFGEMPDDDRLPPGAQEGLFRIAQEALSNVARHARAGQVHLYLGQREAGGPLVLEIQDNGQGFDVDADHGGMGLDNIEQRVQALGGRLSITSLPDTGTRLCISVPLSSRPAPGRERQEMYRPDHTLNKTILVGLGGGLALIVVLFYPLYVQLSGRYVVSRVTGSSAPGLLLGLVAVLLVVAIGLLAARWARADTRQNGTLLGTLAGGVAGATFFFGFGAGAAAAAGNAPLLAHGLGPAGSEAQAIQLLSEAAIGLTWGVYGAFWVALLAGMGLGAIGGLLAPPTGGSLARLSLRRVVISLAGIACPFSVLSLCTSFLIFGFLETAIRQAGIDYALAPGGSLPLAGLSLLPIGSHLVLYLASMGGLYASLRAEAHSNDPAMFRVVLPRAITFGLLALALPLYLWFVSQEPAGLTPAVRGLAILIAAGSLALGGLYLALFVQVYRRRQATDGYRRPPIQSVTILGALLSLFALIWAVNRSTLISLVVASAIIAASITSIVVLWRRRKPPDAGPADLAYWQSSLSSTIDAGLGLIVAITLPLMPLASVISNGLAITLRFPSALFDASTTGQSHLPEVTLDNLVHGAYTTQAAIFLVTVVGATVLVGLLLAIIGGRMALSRWRITQDAEAGA